MKTKRCMGAFLLVWAVVATSSFAQPAKADRELFDQVKAQADKGSAEAQLRLGMFYANGTGVTKDPAKAARWHRKAAEQGFARAQYQLGLDYMNGAGVKRDPVEATNWFRKAADQDLVEAQVDLGLAYVRGIGVEENNPEAVRWFRKAIDQGSPAGLCYLARCYKEGAGVPRDINEAFKLLRTAAEQGFGPAQARLALCFEKGEATEKDLVEAYKWYILAAAEDDEHAADIRVSIAKLEALMTPEQIAQGQRRAREFKPIESGSTAAKPVNNAPAVSATGFVTVNLDDKDSEIFVDGAFVGNPPAKLKVAEGSHTVEVRKAGFKDYRKTLSVSAGADLTLRVVLEKN